MRTPGATPRRAPRPASGRPASKLRILAGALRGRRLVVSRGVRPTEARLREALFSIWSPHLAGCTFLDLFAGSGAVGLEALSRGASRAVFVESDPRASAALRRALAELAPEASRLERTRLPSGLAAWPPADFDLIFADPPYRFVAHEGLLRSVAHLIAADGEMAIEHSARVGLADAPAPWRLRDRRRYGDGCLSFYRQGRGAEAG